MFAKIMKITTSIVSFTIKFIKGKPTHSKNSGNINTGKENIQINGDNNSVTKNDR